MKKLLSIILAISMLVAFVPAVSAAEATQPSFTVKYDVGGIMTKYTMQPTSWGTTLMHMCDVKYTHTNNFFEYAGASHIVNGTLDSAAYQAGTKTIEMKNSAGYLTFKIQVPVDGNYKLEVNHDNAKNGGYVDIYIDNVRKGSYSCYGAAANYFGDSKRNVNDIAKLVNDDGTLGEEATFSLTAGEHTIKFANRANTAVSDAVRASIGTFKLISGDGNGNAIASGSIDAPFELDTLTNPTKELTVSGYFSSTCEAIESFIYSSNDDNVATVSEKGVVTAVGAGTATITASAGTVNALSTTVTVTATDPDAYTVTYDIGGTIIKYGMQKTVSGTSKLHMSNVKYLHTNGFFEYVGADPTVNGTSSNAEYQAGTKTLAMNKEGGYVTFKIDVPYEGSYKLWMDHDLAKEGAFVDVVIDGTTVGTYNCYSASAANNWFGTNNASNHTQSVAKVIGEDGELGAEALFPLTAGEHTITFKNKSGYPVAASKRGSVGTFKLIKGGSDAVKPMHGWATVSNSDGVPVTSLINRQTATANAAVYTTDGVAAATATTITSSNPGVLKVEGTTVTAVGAGEATINATIEYENETYNIESNKILVTDPAITANTVSFYADSYGADVELGITGIDYVQGNVDGTAAANTTVTLTAPTGIEGKVFRGWMRGSKDNGVWISNESEISVTLVSNTFLTAVYDVSETEDEATVEFWNWSGQYLGSETVDKGTEFGEVTEPGIRELTGYEFAGWSVADNEIVSGLTRAVARFDKIKDETAGEAKKYHVTIPEGVTGAETGDFEFDTEVVLNSENPVYWERDGKTVDYGTTYSFYVWDDTVISISTVGNSAPKVILDKHDEYNTYMIEFDKGEADNMRILEAGILFGNDPKVNSFGSKAVAAREDLTHGQFTAVPNSGADSTSAVGYIVYLDGGIARVLYAYDN